MKLVAAITALALTTACTAPIHITKDNTLRVWSDGGGLLDNRMDQIEELRENKTRVEIMGPCASACTMFLGYENTYVHEDVIFGFHGTSHVTGLPLKDKDNYDALLAMHLPKPIREKYWDEWRHMRLATYQVTAKELKEMAPNHVRLMK